MTKRNMLLQLLGDGVRAEGFEQWMNTTLQNSLPAEQLENMSAEQRVRVESRIRIAKTLSVAVIESARTECEAGRNAGEVAGDIAEMIGAGIWGLVANTFEARNAIKATRLLNDLSNNMAMKCARGNIHLEKKS